MDESVISLSLFTPDLDLYDLNRVEVLRGPQGTLFGSGSLAGTVRYISNQPDLSDGYGDFEVGLSTISDGGDGGYVRGMLNVPLGDRAALRVVGYFNEVPGYIDAHGPGGVARRERQRRRATGRPPGAALGADRQHRGHAARHLPGHRLQRLQPRGRLQHPRRTRSRRPSRGWTSGEREQYRQLDEHFDDDFFLGDLTMEFDFGPRGADVDQLVHGPRHSRDPRRLAAHGQRDVLRHPAATADRCASTRRCSTTRPSRCSRRNCGSPPTTTSRFQWVIGGFYSDIERNYGQTLPTPGYDALDRRAPSSAVGSRRQTRRSTRSIPYDFEQKAFFAEVIPRHHGAFRTRRSAARYYDFYRGPRPLFRRPVRRQRRPADRADQRPGLVGRRRRAAARAVRLRHHATTCS